MSKSGSAIVNAATVAIALCALTVTGMVIVDRSERRRGSQREDRPVPDWRQYAAEGHWIGPPDPAFVIVEFGDYQCPVCRHFEQTLRAARHAHPHDLAIVYRHWPLTQHPMAYPAARAAECAADQSKFYEYHSILYDLPNLANVDWIGLADAAGLHDLQAFTECISRSAPVPTIERDIAAVKTIGGTGTPTIIANGIHLAGLPDSAKLATLIRERTEDGR